MGPSPIREVEQKLRAGPGVFLMGLAVFAAAVLLLAGNVELYRLRQEISQWEETLEEQQMRLEEEKQTLPDLEERARQLGLLEPDPEDAVILHIRGQRPD